MEIYIILLKIRIEENMQHHITILGQRSIYMYLFKYFHFLDRDFRFCPYDKILSHIPCYACKIKDK